jgi:small subunit ribosomal protein S19e
MTTVFDVPPDRLIKCVGDKLKAGGASTPPKWAGFVKTGAHREKAPVQRDWWHYRVAAVLRKIYINGPIGVERLSADFGGKRDRGAAPYHAVQGSRSIARMAIHQLEKAGYVTANKSRGRTITPKGRSFVDNTAHESLSELVKTRPEMQKYLKK